jgi:hypothetical protein
MLRFFSRSLIQTRRFSHLVGNKRFYRHYNPLRQTLLSKRLQSSLASTNAVEPPSTSVDLTGCKLYVCILSRLYLVKLISL